MAGALASLKRGRTGTIPAPPPRSGGGAGQPSPEPQALRRKMVAYIANESSLGWLQLPRFRTVELWKPGATETADSPLGLCDPIRLESDPLFPGLVIDRAGFGEL